MYDYLATIWAFGVGAIMSETSKALIACLQDHKRMIRCAESCTAGLIMAELTAISGSSSVVDRGFVTYSNDAKQEMLGVAQSTLMTYGAVSAETAFEMVKGAIGTGPDIYAGISVTGIAGPGGGSDDKPVGTIWIGTAIARDEVLVRHHHFTGNRDEVRSKTVQAALEQLMSQFSEQR